MSELKDRMIMARLLYFGMSHFVDYTLGDIKENCTALALGLNADPLAEVADPHPVWAKARARLVELLHSIQILVDRTEAETVPEVKDALETALEKLEEDFSSQAGEILQDLEEALNVWEKSLQAKASLDLAAEAQRRLQEAAAQTRQAAMPADLPQGD